jgi:hypothetical protein
MVDDRRRRGPALEPKKLASRGNFLGGRVGSLDEGAGAQRQRSGGARVRFRETPPTTRLTSARRVTLELAPRPTTCRPRRPRGERPVYTREVRHRRCRVEPDGESPAKVPRQAAGRPPSSAPTEAALREEGADGGQNRRERAEGRPVARRAVIPLACPEPYRSGERVRGGLAWRPGRLFMAGWKGDAPLMENPNPRTWLLVPRGATPVPLGRGAGAVCGVRTC